MARYNRTLPPTPLVLNDDSDFAVTLDPYAQYDCVGGLAKFFYGTSHGALLRRLKVVDDHVQSEPYILHLYRSSPSTIANDAAIAETFADGKLEIGRIVIGASDYVTANGSAFSVAHIPEVDIEIPDSCEGTVYAYLECTDTPDYNAVTDLYIEAIFWAD